MDRKHAKNAQNKLTCPLTSCFGTASLALVLGPWCLILGGSWSFVARHKQKCWGTNMTPAHDPKPGEWSPLAHQGKSANFAHFFDFCQSMEKMAWDGPKWGQEDFVPTNPNLADILGRTDLDFGIFCFFDSSDPKFLDFQVP